MLDLINRCYYYCWEWRTL